MPRGRVRSPQSASAEMEIFREVERDENVIERIAAARREEQEGEIVELKAEAERVAEEARNRLAELEPEYGTAAKEMIRQVVIGRTVDPAEGDGVLIVDEDLIILPGLQMQLLPQGNS